MGKSFFNGSYTQLYTGTIPFSSAITAAPVPLGLTAIQASAYATLSATYTASFLAAANPDDRSPAKTAARNSAAMSLRVMAANLASIINGTPSVTNERKLELGLSVRATPTAVTELGTPNKFKAEIGGDGSLLIKWQCSSPRATGMTYQVYRKVGGESEWTYVGGSGEKKYTDNALPAGATQVTYQIQAVRSTAVGGWAQYNVTFGTASGGGAMVASVKQEKAPKLVA